MIDNRLLDTHERAVEILNRRANSYHVVTISRIRGLLSVEVLRQALDLIQKRHPLLNSRIVGELNNLRFEAGAIQIPLKVVNKLDSCQWEEVVLEELNEKIASDKVLMRAVLVTIESQRDINYLITTFHHTIIDGLSSVRLHSEILTYCQNIESDEVDSKKIAPLSPLPIIQKIFPKSMLGFSGFIKTIFYLLKMGLKFIFYRPATLGFEKYVTVEHRSSNMLHRQIDAEITKKIISASRRERTTVHGTLCAALLLAIAKVISYNEKSNLCLSCLSYVNLRQRLQTEISDDNLGMLVASINSFHTVGDETSFWDLARNIKQTLEGSLENDDIFSNLLASKTLANFILNNSNQILCSLAVSNIGRVNIPEVYGKFQVEEISFVTAVALFAGVPVVAISTFAGKMFLNFMFSEPSISRVTMEEIADYTINYLKNNVDIL